MIKRLRNILNDLLMVIDIVIDYMNDTAQQIYTQDKVIPILGQAVNSYNSLLHKQDSFRLDLETNQGQDAFNAYMEAIYVLIQVTDSETQSREYRQQYSKAYRLLYSEAGPGYIPEIFDAAQQAYQFIWVNGEAYEFQASTLEKGEKLIQIYFRLIQLIRLMYLHIEAKSHKIPLAYKMQLKERLQEYDAIWIAYEQAYIKELIKIENEAKKGIMEAIEIEHTLQNFEHEQKLKGRIFFHDKQEYHDGRRKLCEKVARFNSVANLNGKGRDDLSYDILLAAENILTKITDSQSKSLRTAADKIRESFMRIREVLRSYSDNIEYIDPQFKNNNSLVEALSEYEASWEKGKRYFLEEKKENQILAFSRILSVAKEKYPGFKELLEYSDPSVFWMIVSVVVLSSLQGEDQGIAQSFLQELNPQQSLRTQYNMLKSSYIQWKIQQSSHKQTFLYNEMQKQLLGQKQGSSDTCSIASKIKQFAINLQRLNPRDWNDMLGILLTDEE